MATAVLKLKIMPESPETNLNAIEDELKRKVEKFGAKIHSVEQELIAFGLVALIVTLAWPEEKGTEEAEREFGQIEGIASIEILDFRRAFG